MKHLRIALTGGIATGKTTVASMFAGLGAAILDADQVARELVEPGTRPWHELLELLGDDYFEPDGRLKRGKLRARISSDKECRSKVDAIMHPAIAAEMESRWRQLARQRPVIFDVPLLFEGGFSKAFDLIILVYAPREVQIERLMARDRLSRRQAEKMLSMQLPIDSKKPQSHFIIDNSLDQEHTRRQVEEIWGKIWETLKE